MRLQQFGNFIRTWVDRDTRRCGRNANAITFDKRPNEIKFNDIIVSYKMSRNDKWKHFNGDRKLTA